MVVAKNDKRRRNRGLAWSCAGPAGTGRREPRPYRAFRSQWHLDVAAGDFEFVRWGGGVARAFEEVEDGLRELVEAPHGGLEGGAPVRWVLEERDGAGVDE